MRPLPPLASPPALPMKTRPFQAIGAAATNSPLRPVGDRRLPNSLAGLEVIGQHAPILGSAEQHAVEVGRPAHGRQDRGRHVLARAPVLGAGRRVDRENVGQGGADQGSVDHDQTGFEARILLGVVGAEDLELADGPGVDLGERRVAVRGERPVIARPVLAGGVQGRRGRKLRRRRGRLVSRVQFRSRLPRRRSPRPDGVARQSDKELHLDWVGAVQQVTGQRACGKERNDPDRRDNQKFSVHSEVFTPRAASREAAETPWIPLLPSTSRLCAQNLRVAQRTTRSVCFGRLADNGLDPRNCEAKLGLRAQSPRVKTAAPVRRQLP